MNALWLKVAALCGGALLVGWAIATAALGQDMHHGVTVVADTARISEERCADLLARYTRQCVAIPTVAPPTRTPPPTPVPLPCEPIGGTKTYQDGEEKMLCFDVKAGPTPKPGDFGTALVQVQSRNHGNASCAHLLMTCTSPTGEIAHSQGVQPGCSFKFAAGKFYVWTKLLQADPAVCRSYTFTVQP